MLSILYIGVEIYFGKVKYSLHISGNINCLSDTTSSDSSDEAKTSLFVVFDALNNNTKTLFGAFLLHLKKGRNTGAF